MKVAAKLNYLRISPRKARMVADTIRGQEVQVAINQLKFMNKRAARPLLKLLNSAVANAKNNFKLKENNLYISELNINEGPTIKRWQPRAMGRATPINKRTSHINIVLDEKIKNKKQEKIKKEKKDKKINKDVKIVKSLDEIKEIGKKGEIKSQAESKKTKDEDYKPEIKDIQREGSGRSKQHLSTIKKKSKSGFLKRVFRRKSI